MRRRTPSFEAHLGQCPRCQADVEFQRRLAADPPQVPPASVDRGWLALRARLDATQAEGRRPHAAHRAAGRVRWLPLALGAQAVLVLLILAAAWLVSSRPDRVPHPGNAAAAPPAANALVVFRPDATESEIRQALRAADARIVGGPTVTDAWLLRLPDSDADSLARLRAAPAVARVESLEGEPAR